MLRRDFVRTLGTVALGGIFVPRFGRWFRSGQLYQREQGILHLTDEDVQRVLKNVYASFRVKAFPQLSPLLSQVRSNGKYAFGGQSLFFDVVTH